MLAVTVRTAHQRSSLRVDVRRNIDHQGTWESSIPLFGDGKGRRLRDWSRRPCREIHCSMNQRVLKTHARAFFHIADEFFVLSDLVSALRTDVPVARMEFIGGHAIAKIP